DLGSDGVTPNDSRGHIGPNNWQNFPALRSALSSQTDTFVTGTFSSGTINGMPYLPYAPFSIDFYANTAADPSGYGEGQTYLGSATVSTDAAGGARFAVDLPIGNLAGNCISATAIDQNGNTSEFS